MKSRSPIVSCLVALLVVAGCASAKTSDRQALASERLPRPDRIWVYDFAATAEDMPTDSAFTGQYAVPTGQTPAQVEAGRKLGALIAAELVGDIRKMGLRAERPSAQTTPQVNDIVIWGCILSVQAGDATQRVAIGFGAGNSELQTAVEGFQMTAQGLRKLGSGTVTSSGSKTPGAAAPLGVALATGNPLGLIVSTGMKVSGESSGSSKIEGRADQTAQEIAKQLKPRFQQQGWIK